MIDIAAGPLYRRLAALLIGLFLYGFSMALMVTGGLGLNPWDVFHQGLRNQLSIGFGAATAVAGVGVLLLWIPLRQRPGVGTVANVIVIAISVDAALAWLPDAHSYALRGAFLVCGIVLNGFATALYISAALGPGPRDGLMTGLAARTGWSIRVVRTGIEASVLGVGWALGGTAGIGTVLYAVAIGPLVQLFMRVFPPAQSSADRSVPAERISTDTP